MTEVKDCCDNCKKGNTEECEDYGGFHFYTIFEEDPITETLTWKTQRYEERRDWI